MVPTATRVDTAELRYRGQVLELPVLEGTEHERALDISRLRDQTGLVTLDYGYKNTGACQSAITYLDGEQGVLRYRGYPVEELAEKSRFVEVAYLLVHGKLPNRVDHDHFSELLTRHSMLHEDMCQFFKNYPEHAHPMAILSAMVVSLSSFYPELSQEQAQTDEEIDITTTRLLSKLRTIAAFSYKKSVGEPVVYPRHDLKYCANFLNMMFSSPVKPHEVNPELVKALNVLLILHADHEQNCSTSAVRLVGSAKVNLYAAVAAGISALWGPLHGGASQEVLEMLDEIYRQGGDVKNVIERAKSKKMRLMGFGHRVYKNYDPRAKVIRKTCTEVLGTLKVKDPLLDIAMELEERVLSDEYFTSRKLYPNVDFYSGIIYRAMGIPTNMLTVMFAIGRLPGWIAQWKEAQEDPDFKIQRPRQIYTGPEVRHYVPIEERN